MFCLSLSNFLENFFWNFQASQIYRKFWSPSNICAEVYFFYSFHFLLIVFINFGVLRRDIGCFEEESVVYLFVFSSGFYSLLSYILVP